MRGPKLWALLAGSAIAVGFQNYVFFSNLDGGPALGSVFDEMIEEDDLDDEAVDAMLPISALEVDTWIETLPAPGRNPFLTAAEAEALGGGPIHHALPQVVGTLWSPDRRVAWIDGLPHSEGDWIGEHRVESIGPGGVVLRQGEARLHLRASPRADAPDSNPEEVPSDEN